MDSLKVFLLCSVVAFVTQGDVVSALLHLTQRDIRGSTLLFTVPEVCLLQGSDQEVPPVVDSFLWFWEEPSQQEVTVEPEQSVLLQCHSPTCENIQVLTWTRPDLRADGYVYFYRNKRSYENYQLPSFQGRVELRDPDMKDGDVSLVLRNVTAADAGTYSCYVSVRNMGGSKVTHSEMWHLTVSSQSGETPEGLWDRRTMDPEDKKPQEVLKGETAAAAVALAAVGVVVVVVVVVAVVAKCLKGKQDVQQKLPSLNFIQIKK